MVGGNWEGESSIVDKKAYGGSGESAGKDQK